MNKLLFICSRTTNDENRGVIAVQESYIIEDMNLHIGRFDTQVICDLYIAVEIKDLSGDEAVIRRTECEKILGTICKYNSMDVFRRAKKELESIFDSIEVFDNKFNTRSFNFHKQ